VIFQYAKNFVALFEIFAAITIGISVAPQDWQSEFQCPPAQ